MTYYTYALTCKGRHCAHRYDICFGLSSKRWHCLCAWGVFCPVHGPVARPYPQTTWPVLPRTSRVP